MNQPNPETPAPAAPAAPETPAAPAAPATPAVPETPAAPAIKPEEVEALKTSAANWSAVEGLFNKKEDGSLEIKPEALPQPSRRETFDDPDEQARIEAERARQADLDEKVRQRTSAIGTKINADLNLQRRLEDELTSEPGGNMIMDHARLVMEKVPVENRTEKAWRNAIKFVRGETESKRRELWMPEAQRKAEENLLKLHNLRIPRPAAAVKTVEEVAANLSPKQKEAAAKMGLSEKDYAESQMEMQRGGRS